MAHAPLRTRPTCLALVLLVSLATACGGDSESPTGPTQNVPRGEYAQTDVRAGTGATAVAGNRLTVHYTGWVYDPTQPESKGRQFQTSVGGTPFSFTLGVGGVIRGWDQGVAGMRVGGLRRLVLPPELAYGSSPPSGSGIPPNATLVFDVDLVSIP